MPLTYPSQSKPETEQGTSAIAERYWLSLAVACAVVLLAAAIRWSLAHPFGVHWDESGYLNEVLIDAQRLRGGMLVKFFGRLVLKAIGRPPAYRFLADPLLAIFGGSTVVARLSSLIFSVLTGWFIFRTVRLCASRPAAAIAAIIFMLSPEVVGASAFLSTDAPLYLATAALLYYLIKSCNERLEDSKAWLGLGLSFALGLLSKTSFFLIGFPALLLWFISPTGRKAIRRHPLFPIKAAALAMLLSVPWWVVNFKSSLAYGKYARGFVRNSLGPVSLGTWMRWINSVWQCLLGHGVTAFAVGVVIAYLYMALRKGNQKLGTTQKTAIALCAAAALPIILAQLTGTNHLLRHISPAVIAMAIVIGVLSDHSALTRPIGWTVAASLPLLLQLGMIVYPVLKPNNSAVDLGFVNSTVPWHVLARFDQWDWEPIYRISTECKIGDPKIGYLGGGRELNPEAIAYPWVKNAFYTHDSTFAYPDVAWLWRYEDGPIDWRQMMSTAESKDILITAPGYSGESRLKEELDNRYNSEFADRLSADDKFQRLATLSVGRFEPVRIKVFAKKSLNCAPGAPESQQP
jgi:4-amino-4-deoxy-L-arabinose transferase-like glycosyltransferase